MIENIGNDGMLRGVILVGGLANSVSLCRSLGRAGIPVTICAISRCPAHFSRFCKRSLKPNAGEPTEQFWKRALVEDRCPRLSGHVLFACNDEAIEFIANNEDKLRRHYILEKIPGLLRLALLDKKQSMDIATRAGLNSPRYISVATMQDVSNALQQTELPILVRPAVSHEFTIVFHRKLVLCHTGDEVRSTCQTAFDAGIDVTLCEYIPGDDDRLCSYYTYIDDSGEPLFKYTKRVIRRYPKNFGEGSYHVTQWLPDVAVAGQAFFDAAGLRGLGNIEFKRDPRDGKLKFIECNARFTAAHEIFIKSRFDIGRFIYGKLTGQSYSLPETFDENVKMSIALRDLRAHRELSKQGEGSILSWVPETISARAYPYFEWSDPGPLVARIARRFL